MTSGATGVGLPRESLVVEKLADLAQGGMGSVEVGIVRSGRLNGRVLAIKRLHEELARDEEVVSMFVDEAWLTSQIRSPHVVTVEAFGEDARGLFLATELVQGVSLGRLVAEVRARGETFSERIVVFLATQVCAGLAAAHDLHDAEGRALGLVHRDLTPGNVLVGFDGVAKIADFGIAKAERRVSAATRMGVLKGKPSYVSPEQVRGGHIDGRADLFALGVVLFELLVGYRPWRGKDDTDILIAMMRTEPVRLGDLRPDVSPVVARLIDSCLRKQVVERPQSAEEVRTTLEAHRAERGWGGEDRQHLSEFVRRNAHELAAWFDQALAEHMAQGGPSLEQVEKDVEHTRVQPSPAVGEDFTNEQATSFYQHPTPAPGAAAMAAALAAGGRPPSTSAPSAYDDMPESAPTMAIHGSSGLELLAAIERQRQGGMGGAAVPVGAAARGAAELSRLPAPTPQRYPGRTELLPNSGPMGPSSAGPAPFAPSSGAVSSAPRSAPNVTEWMAGSSSRGSRPFEQPVSSGNSPLSSTIFAPPSEAALATTPQRAQPSAASAKAPAGGGGLRIALVFLAVFVLTVAIVGALLRSGVFRVD